MRPLVLLALLCGTAAAAGPLAGSRQVIVVRAKNWKSTTGTLQAFRRAPGGPWRPASPPVAVALGAAGLGWGRGVAPRDPDAAPEAIPGPAKQEGDNRTPVGVFFITGATGRADAPPPGTKLPYRHAGEHLVCVDDPKSRSYTRLVEAGPGADWRSFERMDQEGVYEWTLTVRHNPDAVPGGGSCIFLHVWRGPDHPTAGCTAMERPALERLLGWLDPAASPRLVVLPDEAFVGLRRAWDLPPMRRPEP